MKTHLPRAAIFAIFLITFSFQLCAETNSSTITPSAILNVMQRVADWQLANPSPHSPTDWTQGAGDAGFMALAGISGNTKYRDAMLAMGETNHWQLGSRKYHADDQCVGQTYTELYFLYREAKMIGPMRQQFDDILAHPPNVTTLEFNREGADLSWSWCDSLFMAPPAWVRLYYATGDEKYLNLAVTNWWRTTDYLYDTNEHLFFRDSTYFTKQEANGKKVFWSRGNGWVMAGLVRLLQYLPTNHPDRPRFEKLFKDMSAKILTCQQADGLWRTSLLDPDSYPLKETSGSGFYTYALAWGVNQCLLDRAKFKPAIQKAWTALVSCVDANDKLTHVQPIGADPKKFTPESTEIYGVGAFLLAGSEVYRMAVLALTKEITLYDNTNPTITVRTNTAVNGIWWRATIKVKNPAAFFRESETVELSSEDVGLSWTAGGCKLTAVDCVSSRVLDSQIVPSEKGAITENLLFQIDLAPGETRTFYILGFPRLAEMPVAQPIVKTMARYVPERFDDFAWESDRIAHRIYGQALIKAEGTISSGADVWIKKDRGLIVDTMYATKHYHEDNGSFMDDYRVGKSRGCGGLGIWDGKKLYVSSNWKTWKLITTGPIRSEFELTYDAWDAGNSRMVSEVKRFSIDAGSWMTKVTSKIYSADRSPLTIGVGLAERACPTNREEFIAHDLMEGWMTYWQPEDQPKGTTAVAIILPKGSVEEFTNDNPDMPDSVKHADVPQPTHEGYPPIRTQLAITQFALTSAADGNSLPNSFASPFTDNSSARLMTYFYKPFTYYFGACWDRSGDFTNHVQWENYVKCFAERRDQPLQVTVGN